VRTRSSPWPRPPLPSLCTPSLALRGRVVASAWTGFCVRVDGILRPRGRTKKKKNNNNNFLIIVILGCWLLEKRGKKCSVFGFQSPRSPSSPSSPSSAGEATRRRRLFWPSSPSHPSKLYSSLGWLNSKVPKPFFPFTPRLIDVDGF
jgi:hypothetical protein